MCVGCLVGSEVCSAFGEKDIEHEVGCIIGTEVNGVADGAEVIVSLVGLLVSPLVVEF